MCTYFEGKNIFFGSTISKFTKHYIQPASKSKDVFFGSSISKFTEHHIQPATRVENLLATHLEDDCIWNNTDPGDVSLDNTSDSEGPVNSTMTPTSIKIENNSNTTQDSVAATTTIILEENNKTWYNTNEEYNSWHNAAETMDNYQEWTDPTTVVGDTDITDPIIEHIKPRIHQGNQHTGSLKSTISTPNSGYQFLHSMLYKVICFMLLCTFKASVTTCKAIIYVIETLSDIVISTPIVMYNWCNKPCIRHTKKHRKTSNDSDKFSHKIRASKKSCTTNGSVNPEDTVVDTHS